MIQPKEADVEINTFKCTINISRFKSGKIYFKNHNIEVYLNFIENTKGLIRNMLDTEN